MKVGCTYHVYNKVINANAIVKVLKVINKSYICKDIDNDFNSFIVFTDDILSDCELTLLENDNYPTVVDSNDYRVNIS